MSLTFEAASAALKTAIQVASKGLIDREPLVELIALAAVAEEHLLVVGPPGTAKSEAVRRVARALGGRYFEYLLGRFTEPSEIFGPVDLRKLKEGVVETETTGMLPEAEIAFLDEVFLGSTAILNTLLGLLNERSFRRGHTRIRVPLRLCVGATNALPQDESLAAFADRFLARIFLEPIPDPQLEDLLAGGWSLGGGKEEESASIEHVDLLAGVARAADMIKVRPHLAHAIRILRTNGISVSDRRAVKTQRLIAAAAALAGRRTPTEADLWPLVFAIPTQDAQAVARDALREVLQRSENETLAAAAEEASMGPRARATRIRSMGEQILAARPDGKDKAEVDAWRLKLEGVAREIDAGFVTTDLPAELREMRDQIVRLIEPRPQGASPPS
jgi:MoxR-like ATPase